jgi:hypothetical protein
LCGTSSAALLWSVPPYEMLPTQSSRTAPVPGSNLQGLCPYACCLPNLSSSALPTTTLCSFALCADCLRSSGL